MNPNKFVNIKIIMLIGLPGSGKSTYAKEYKTSHGETGDIQILDFDEMTRYKDSYIHPKHNSRLHNFLLNKLDNVKGCLEWWNRRTFICDGLFPTQQSRAEVITDIVNICAENCPDFQISFYVKFVVWNEDREACLANDQRRTDMYGKSRSANLTINNMKIETPVCDSSLMLSGVIQEIYYDYIEHRDVFKLRSESQEKIFKHVSWGETSIMKSESWSLGGTCGCCWSSELDTVAPDPEIEFEEFDRLLEEVCPQITFLQYKNIRQKCVVDKEWSESDYYGGSVTKKCWVCDLTKLYEMLLEKGLISEEDD